MNGGAIAVHDAVILTGDAKRAAAFAVNFTRERMRQERGSTSTQLDRLASMLSDRPHTDTPEPAPEESDNSQSARLLSTGEAATLLGISERSARRLAPKMGGRFIAGRWLIPEAAVVQHIEGRMT